jgi:diguanylate cyclase (GGDEF)-like protein
VSRLDKSWQPFVVLIASNSDLRARGLDSVLETSGYSVLRARTGEHAIELACTANPDAVILDAHTPDISGLEVCRRIRGDARFPATTPVFLTTSDGNTRSERLEAYSAGAWEVYSQPLDGALLLLKLQTFMRAKLVSERLREASLIDDLTGLYTREGLMHRAREIGATAVRHREALACVAFAPVEQAAGATESHATSVIERLAETCRRNVRTSDVLGRLGGAEFAVIAPATDMDGARGMMERLQQLLNPPPGVTGLYAALTLRVGYCVTTNLADSPVGAADMLAEAASALHAAPLTLAPPRALTPTSAVRHASPARGLTGYHSPVLY